MSKNGWTFGVQTRGLKGVAEVRRKLLEGQSGAANFSNKPGQVNTSRNRRVSRIISHAIGRELTATEEALIEADLSLIGIAPGRTSGTLPERTTVKWLLSHGYKYGGMYNFDPTRDFGFQIPLAGGRNAFGGGAVADIYLSPSTVSNQWGAVIRVNGAYWHLRASNEARDANQKFTLEAIGYKVYDLLDLDALNPGALDSFMSGILGAGYKV